MKASEIIAKLSLEILEKYEKDPSSSQVINAYRAGIKDGLRKAFVQVKLAEVEEESK